MRVLIVDDSTTVRKLARRELEAGGYEIIEASDVMTAQQQLRTKSDISLMVLDIQMPDMDGLLFMKKLREPATIKTLEQLNNSRIPILMLSSSDSDSNRQAGLDLGAVDFISKPFIKGELIERIDSILKPQLQFRDFSVLVVLESHVVKNAVTASLRQIGVSVVEAENDSSMLAAITEHKSAISMVILESSLSRMKGEEMCRLIRNKTDMQDTPVLLICDQSSRHLAAQMFSAGVTDCIWTPFIKEELDARIRIHLDYQRMNKILRRDVYELKQLDKLKDNFLAVCSHDLKAPLTAIKSASDFLIELGGMDETRAEMTKVIKNSAEDGIQFIAELLDIGRAASAINKAEMISLSLADVVSSAVHMFRPVAAKKEIKLLFSDGGSNALVTGNHGALSRVFNNLISNAIKFTPTGGTVTVEITRLHRAMVNVSVTDTGMGIPAEKISKLFDPFSGLARTGTAGEKSTGLGLSITRELVVLHEATIEVRSEEEKGSTFTVSLPSY